MILGLQNSRPLHHEPPKIPTLIDTDCYVDDYSKYTIECYLPFNNSWTTADIACNGIKGTISVRCPYHQQISSCNAISNYSTTVHSGCNFDSYSSSDTLCSCDFNRFYAANDSSSRRRLLPDMEKFTSIESNSLLFVSMEAGTVVNTGIIFTKFDNKPIFIKSIVSGATIGVVFFLLLLGLAWFQQNPFDKKLEKADKAPRINLVNQERYQNTDGHIEVQMLENSLPYVFREMTKPFLKRLIHELIHHHKWLSFLHTDHNTSKVREFKLISLVLHIASFLVINGLIYQLNEPDDGYCEALLLKEQCLEPTTSFVYYFPKKKCYWEGSVKNGLCHFIQPSTNTMISLYVTFYAGFLSYPLSSIMDWIVWKYLACPAIGATAKVAPDIIREKATTTLKEDLEFLVTEIHRHRMSLKEDDLQQFDNEWGLDDDGVFTFKSPTDVRIRRVLYRDRILCENILTDNVIDGRMRIAADMELIRRGIETELRTLYQDVWLKRQGNRLLYLFIRDLLPKHAKKFLEMKLFRDSHEYIPQRKEIRSRCWKIVISTMVLYVSYLVQFTILQSYHRQVAWLKSFALWVAFDVVIVSTLVTYITHVFIPSMIMIDLRRVKRSILKLIIAFYDKLQFNNKLVYGDKIELHYNRVDTFDIDHDHFNVAKHTFISYRLAMMFDDLEESKIIQLFSSYSPHSVIRESHHHGNKYDYKHHTNKHHRYFHIIPSIITYCLRFIVSNHILPQKFWIPLWAYALMLSTIFMLSYLILRMNPWLISFPIIIALISYTFFKYTSKPQAIAQFGNLRSIINKKREEYISRRDKYHSKLKHKNLYPAALKASQIANAKNIHKEITNRSDKRNWLSSSSSFLSTNNDNDDNNFIEKAKNEIQSFVNGASSGKTPSRGSRRRLRNCGCLRLCCDCYRRDNGCPVCRCC